MKARRIWEVDFLRGMAVVMMIIFHALFDLKVFAGVGPDINSGFWLFFGRLTAIIFLFLVGISLTLSFSRDKNANFLKFLVRGARIFAWGLIITIVTWMFYPQNFIMFGALHFVGISIILGYPFLLSRNWFRSRN